MYLRPFHLWLVLATFASSPAWSQSATPVGPPAIERWVSQTLAPPHTLSYTVDRDVDADHCELFVNSFGRGDWNHGGVTVDWLEAFVSVHPDVDSDVLNVGLYVQYTDTDTSPPTLRHAISVVDAPYTAPSATSPEEHYYRVGFRIRHLVPSQLGGGLSDRVPQRVAFFVDLRRNNEVVRVWQSARGQNFLATDEVFSANSPYGTCVESLGSGSVRWLGSSHSVFDQRKACIDGLPPALRDHRRERICDAKPQSGVVHGLPN